MKKEFLTVACDACIAATAEQAAEQLGCPAEQVQLAHATNRQKLGFCWVQMKNKKAVKFTPAFKNNIFDETTDIKNVRMDIYTQNAYFVKDGIYYLYDIEEKTISQVNVLFSEKLVRERARLAGIIGASPVMMAIIKQEDKKVQTIYAWRVKDTTIYPIFPDDDKLLKDEKGKALPLCQLRAKILDKGQYVRKNEKIYMIMWNSRDGFLIS